jgi:Ras-related protein Rab-5C
MLAKGVKVVLAGTEGSGKTSIIRRLTTKKFAMDSAPTISASQSEYTTQLEDGSSAKLRIWDTAGQEQYESLTVNYFRDAAAVIVVYDVSGFDSVAPVAKWIGKYRDVVPHGVVVVAGNKIDLLEDVEVGKQQRLDMEEEVGGSVILCSAKTGEGIEELFAFVAQQIAANAHQLTIQPVNVLDSQQEAGRQESKGCSC